MKIIDLYGNEKYLNLPDDVKHHVFDQLSKEDERFNTLDPDAKDHVRGTIMRGERVDAPDAPDVPDEVAKHPMMTSSATPFVRGSAPRISSEDVVREDARTFGEILSSGCLLYTSPSPRDRTRSRMPSSA